MADKAISELISADQITATDMFVLEQNGTAKKLTGQVLLNWLTKAADGHGGIHDIEKVSSSGLVDTYRITLADTTTFDFMVTNGKGIQDIEKSSTSGLVDTYTVRYNDGTSDTITVTNGEKGDKGDNTYVWIKYASQEPTESSHSFGNLPDDWIGIYYGHLAEAPADWKEYSWFEIKGEKGDTGDPATLVSASITYQQGDSGTIIPSGTWSENIPSVQQGKYLWTRKITQWNTGNPITEYTVARFGIDGSGSVSSVNDISPDENGNIAVNAASVGALPIGGGTLEGAVNMNGQKLSGLNAPTDTDEAATKGFVDASVKKAAPWNFLDNSDFTNPVNQRGVTTATAYTYFIDRWEARANAEVASLTANGILFDASALGANVIIRQNIATLKNGTYTVAAYNADGTIKGIRVYDISGATVTQKASNVDNDIYVGLAWSANETYYIELTCRSGCRTTFGMAALYEGEYTRDTLPEYRPKGYTAELLECQRYFYSTVGAYFYCGYGSAISETEFYATMFLPVPMRVNPTVSGQFIARGGGKEHQLTFVSINQRAANGISMVFTGSSMIPLEAYILRAGSRIELSADL